MNFVLDLQGRDTGNKADEGRACNVISFASCSLCSVSAASIVACLTI